MLISFRIQAAAALLGLALLVGVLVTGVAGGGSAQPRPAGDTYVEAMVGAPHLVNPLLASSDTDRDLAYLVFSGLTRVDEQGKLAPDLASGWTTSPDATIYTFTLRPNLYWHDGTLLTADDVLFTLGQSSLLRDKAFPGDAALAATWRDVKVDAPDTRTVRLTLPAPDASFLQYTTIGILPRHLWGDVKAADMASSDLNTAPVGSGPWRYPRDGAPQAGDTSGDAGAPAAGDGAEQAPGVMLEPNPRVPGTSGSIARLWFRPYPSFGAALTALKMGEVHGLGHIPIDQVSEVERVAGVTVHRQPLARYTMLLMNTMSPLLDSAQARRGIELAINRQAIPAERLSGEARVLDSPVLPESWAYDYGSKHAEYNPGAAGRLLDAAGWRMQPNGVRARDGVTMTLVLAANRDIPANVAMAEDIAKQLQAVGIDAQLAPVSRDRLLNDYIAPRAFHLALVSWEAPGADPDVIDSWHSREGSMGLFNFAGWRNAAADKALEASRQSVDMAARSAHFKEFQQLFKQEAPSVILYEPMYAYATRLPADGVRLPEGDLLSPAQRFDTIGDWYLRADAQP